MASFDESKTYRARIVYIQASVPPGSGDLKATMFAGKLVHNGSEPVGDGRLWEMVDCDIIVIPRKRYVQADGQAHSIEYARSIMGKMEEWKEANP